MNDDTEEELLSLERARADIEIIQSCYPDEISSSSPCDDSSTFPFQFTLNLSEDSSESSLILKVEPGYPVASGVQIADYRTDSLRQKARLEAVVRAVRRVSSECQADEVEGCIACCAVAFETWNDYSHDENKDSTGGDDNETESTTKNASIPSAATIPKKEYKWISGEPLLDKKSSFQAHLCEVYSELEVQEALQQLLTSSSKIQRATHNMYAWRIAETTPSDGDNDGRVIIKHDNDDDGEDGAGNKMAYLLDMRKDENVLVVVSRWFGGIHLGPKRFAHIVNVSRMLLVEYTDKKVEDVNSNSKKK
jgi:putative IMPACT (imprinted ancient) family translation regulator